MSAPPFALPDTPAAATPRAVVRQVARRLGARMGRALMLVSGLCLGIALLFTVWFGGGFYQQLVYSLSIGLCCWAITDGTRLLLIAATEITRQRMGLPADATAGRLGWRGMIPLVLMSTLLGPPLGIALSDAILGRHSPPLWALDSPSARITLTVSLLATVIATLAFSWQERLAAMQTEAQAARRDQAESQLRLLQSQLEPHMLFNTLANLRVLIGLDPVRAQAMLDRLIAYLRATLQASRVTLHPLADEFDRLADYLALMQVRMGARLVVSLDLPVDLRPLRVPPLILQPLVENSIRHGLEPQVAGGSLRVTAQRVGTELQLRVTDDGAGLGGTAAGPPSTGFGLEQVRSRLSTLYGPMAALDVQAGPEGRGTQALVRLPIEPAPATTTTGPST